MRIFYRHPVIAKFMFWNANEILAILIALIQGYVSIPEYRLLYVLGCFVAHRWMPEHKRELNPISTLNFFIELSALALTSLSLLIPYLVYFELALPPEGVNALWLWSFAIGFLAFRIQQEIWFAYVRRQQPIYVDLENRDERGRYVLNSFWTYRDLERYLIQLEQGATINVYAYESSPTKRRQRKITGKGTVYFDGKESHWVTQITWGA